MQQQGDLFVLTLVVGAFLIWILRRGYSWLTKPQSTGSAAPIPRQGEHVDLLTEHGFEWLSGKQKVPIHIQAGERTFDSRLFIEGIAVKNGKRYVVKVSREQKPLRWSGAAVRDALMVYQLICEADGVVYVDLQHQKVKEASFQPDIPKLKPIQRAWWPCFIGMVFGIWLTYVMLQ